jgi:hypothetical protein
MQTSLFLARLIGPVMLVLGAALLINAREFRAVMDDFIANPTFAFLTGLMALPAGLAIVLTHNVWAADWRVLITLIGWLTIFKGAIRLLAPQQVTNIGRQLLAKPQILTISAAIWILLGAVLCFFGYVR